MVFSKKHFVKQHDSMQCGVACLSMISKYYGMNYSIPFLSSFCHATTEGVSIMGIVEAAKQIHFEAVAGRISLNKLDATYLPCILHWNQNHFVILYNIKRNRYYIADPGQGLRIYNLNEFKRFWLTTKTDIDDQGIAIFLKPDAKFGQIIEPTKEKRTFKFLFKYITQYKGSIFQIILGLLLGCVLQLIMPFLTQAIVDVGIYNQDIGLIWLILIGELTIVIGRTFTDFIRRWLLLHISMRINISLVSDFFIKLLKLPMSYFDTKLLGDLLQRMGDHSRVQSFLTNQTLNVVFTLFYFIVFGFVLFLYNKIVFATFVVCSLVYGLWIAIFLSKRKVIDYELFAIQAINQNKTYQFITSIQEIKLQDCENRRRWEWEDIQADLYTIQMKSLKLQQTQEAGSVFINELKNILITVLTATSVIEGEMTLGMMLAVQYIIGQLNSPIEQLMSFIYSIQDVQISLERINEIHLSDNEEKISRNCISFPEQKSIELSHVNFKYNLHSPNLTIDDVSFSIPQGKVTAIVGASGSGKTTIMKLILGFYEATSGCINISGTNINNYDLKWWRRNCGVVMQDGVIFSESIARNIAIDDNDIDFAKLENASKIANIYDYVIGLPLGFNTMIGKDGVGLSQGQKQRILIARAVYKDPNFIFLDEATNALDAKNERVIVDNLNKFYQGRTVVVVAHRLSTVKNADQIIVLDMGKVVEIGDHNSLINKQGVYYNLVKNQLELGS